MGKWVTVATFDNPIEANIVKALLQSEGFPVFLVGEHFLTSQKMFNVGLADISLQVPSEVAAEVKEVLKLYRQGYFLEPLKTEFDLPSQICPNCGSSDIVLIPLVHSLVTVILMAYLFIGRVIPPKKYKVCNECKSKIQE